MIPCCKKCGQPLTRVGKFLWTCTNITRKGWSFDPEYCSEYCCWKRIE